jgi:multiple sugar transport system permease protein
MVIAYTSLSLPFTIWVMYAFFRDFPSEIEEAAKIDGCNFFNLFVRVVLPISAPGVIATFILTLIYPWNDLLLNTVLSSSIRSQNISSALLQFNTTYQIYWGHLAAGAIVASFPVIIFTLLLQKYIVQGLTIGAVKG